MGATNDAGSYLERTEMTTHDGTHIDALGHFAKGDKLYGGYSATETVDDFGLTNLGIEHMPPMVTRGILLDVSRLDGGDYLESCRAVTVADLEKAGPDMVWVAEAYGYDAPSLMGYLAARTETVQIAAGIIKGEQA